MNKERTANIVQGFSPVILQTLKKKKVLQFLSSALFSWTLSFTVPKS